MAKSNNTLFYVIGIMALAGGGYYLYSKNKDIDNSITGSVTNTGLPKSKYNRGMDILLPFLTKWKGINSPTLLMYNESYNQSNSVMTKFPNIIKINGTLYDLYATLDAKPYVDDLLTLEPINRLYKEYLPSWKIFSPFLEFGNKYFSNNPSIYNYEGNNNYVVYQIASTDGKKLVLLYENKYKATVDTFLKELNTLYTELNKIQNS